MDKIVITVVGSDKIGIIAAVCNYLAENNANILDISQTIIDGFFNMIMIIDGQNIKNLTSFQEGLKNVGNEKNVIIQVQRAEIFDKMHRI